jgi:hypothetical protein
MDDDVAPGRGFRSFSPVFPVRDLRRALAHYASLGFEVEPSAGGDGYGFAERDEVSLHLSLDEGHGPEGGHQHVGTAYLYVEDADALYEEWAQPAVGGLTRRVGDTPYKLREGSHVDPDGNLIRFGSPMPGRPGERLRAHTETRYGITADEITELDLGVWRVRRADGRPGGAWHHLADGLPSAEIAAAGRVLAEAAPLIPDAERAAFDALRAEVAALDAAEGLPEGLIHPDFVLANVVATTGGMVLVDWAGAGRGPRLWPLAFLLYAEAAKEPRRAGAVLLGYREHVTLEAEELDRLGAAARARPLILRAWSVCRGQTTPTGAMTAASKTNALTEMIATRVRAAMTGR